MAKSKTESPVVESTDPAISQELPAEEEQAASEEQAEGSTGEIDAATASKESSLENETGKTMPNFSEPQLAKPEKAEDVPAGTTGMTSGKKIDEQVKLYPVQVNTYVKAKIGPRWYEFKKGGLYNVPDVVKERLKKRGVLVAI